MVRVVDADVRTRRVTFSLEAYEEIDAPKIDYSKAQRVNPKGAGKASRAHNSKGSKYNKSYSKGKKSTKKDYPKKKNKKRR